MAGDDARARTLMGTGGVSRVVEAGGVATSVVEAGDGPPLLLLHGGVESGASVWAPVLDLLARSHRVVAPDLPGLGQSAPMEHLDVQSFGRWFGDLLRVTGVERPTLVVHSVLGSLATRWATGAPAALASLVVCAVPGVARYRMPVRLPYLAIRFSIRPTDRNAERFDRFLMRDLDAVRARDRSWYAAFDEYNRARAVVPHVKQTMSRLGRLGTKRIPDEDLERLDVPVHLVWGRRDRMVPLAVGEQAAARHGWPLHVIEDAAHAPQIEQPDAFADAVSRVAGA